MREFTYGAFPALAGDAGALDTTKACRLRCTEVITIEAGNRERLEDVQFYEVHFHFLSFRVEWVEEEEAQNQSPWLDRFRHQTQRETVFHH